MNILENVVLRSYTTLELGGTAKFFVTVFNMDELIEVLEFAREQDLPVFILGGGSNLLISDLGFDGLLIKIAIAGIESFGDNANKRVFRVGAGENWDTFVQFAVNKSLWGIECLSGISGLVGASPIQNIGAYGQEVKDVIESVEVVNIETLHKKTYERSSCDFSYRNSRFKKTKEEVITHVTYNLLKNKKPVFKHKVLSDYFTSVTPNPTQIREKVLEIRKSKSMIYSKNDLNSHSTGSFFINPIISKKLASTLLKKHSNLPHWEEGGRVKISAAWLIENAGFYKGYKYKTASISDKHVLAFVNRGTGLAQDYYELSNHIQEKVYTLFNIKLEPETQFLGVFD